MEGTSNGPSRRKRSGSHMKNWSAYLLFPGLAWSPPSLLFPLHVLAAPLRSSKKARNRNRNQSVNCQNAPGRDAKTCLLFSESSPDLGLALPCRVNRERGERRKCGSYGIDRVRGCPQTQSHRRHTPVLLCRVFQARRKKARETSDRQKTRDLSFAILKFASQDFTLTLNSSRQ